MTITPVHFRPSSQLPEHSVLKGPEISKPSAREVKGALPASQQTTFGSTRKRADNRNAELDSNSRRPTDTTRNRSALESEEAEPQWTLIRKPRAVDSQSAAPATPGNLRKSGDSQMALRVAQALRLGESTGSVPERIENIVPTSTFGQWWAHLHEGMQ